jgi:hypothetical protein
MSLYKYRKVLALPRVLPAILFMFVAGLPLTIMSLTLTLHVISDLGRGYSMRESWEPPPRSALRSAPRCLAA